MLEGSIAHQTQLLYCTDVRECHKQPPISYIALSSRRLNTASTERIESIHKGINHFYFMKHMTPIMRSYFSLGKIIAFGLFLFYTYTTIRYMNNKLKNPQNIVMREVIWKNAVLQFKGNSLIC